jgi:small subunit ribosomal protein S20
LATHKSAAKRARQTVRKNKVNTSRKNAVRSFEKSLVKALATKDAKTMPELLKAFTSQIMKAAQRGLFKKEAASRKIARLSSRVHAALNSK